MVFDVFHILIMIILVINYLCRRIIWIGVYLHGWWKKNLKLQFKLTV